MNPEDAALPESTPGEGTDPKPEEGAALPEGEATPPQSDPLDGITDPDELRNKAKGYRSAGTRYKTERDEAKANAAPAPAPEATPAPTGEGFVAKKDFYKGNEKKAIRSLTRAEDTDSAEVKAEKAYLTENWDHITKLYTPRSGKDTPEDIRDDLNDAITLFRKKNPPKQDDGTGDLAPISSPGGSGSAPTPETENVESKLPGFEQSRQPMDKDGKVNWYPDKREKSE